MTKVAKENVSKITVISIKKTTNYNTASKMIGALN